MARQLETAIPTRAGHERSGIARTSSNNREEPIMTNLMRASNQAASRRLAARYFWKSILALALLCLSTASAFAGPSVRIADTNMFRPRGMVRATVHLPGGGEITDYWVSDGASGFCR